MEDGWKSINFDINDKLKASEFEASGSIKRNAQSIQGRGGFSTFLDESATYSCIRHSRIHEVVLDQYFLCLELHNASPRL